MSEILPLRIAFTGPMGSGKTTHAKLLQKAHGGDVLSFSTPLKKISRELFGDELDDTQRARYIYQELGVAVRRIDSETWVRMLLAKVSPNRPCYVDDCRFYNEYIALHNLGFQFIRLGAPMELLAERRPGLTYAQRLHESEIESATIPGDLILSTEPSIEAVEASLASWVRAHHPELKPKRVTVER